MEQFKALQVRLDPELHRKFRLHAIGTGVGMSELVTRWVKSVVEPQKVPAGMKMTVLHELKPIAPIALGSHDPGVCSLCGKTGVKTALNKDKKWVCYECAGVK